MKHPMEFSHDETGYPLLGAHQFVNCGSCHLSKKFTHVSTACADCHTDIHRGQFGIDCQGCHTSLNWQDQKDNLMLHSMQGFPLIGVHAIADCDACHTKNLQKEFVGTPVDCNGCHMDNFITTLSPNHVKANFSLECQSCHTSVATTWDLTTFEHPDRFQLRGAHQNLDCNGCHSTTFAGTPRDCFECHRRDYQMTSFPSHTTWRFPTDCQICHTEVHWEGAEFDHLRFSGFELRGAHVQLNCNSCHINNRPTGLPRDCYGCHEQDYQATTFPAHLDFSFPTDCQICHTEVQWQGAQFDHLQASGFELRGAHAQLNCNTCHPDGQSSDLPQDCYGCHQNDFNSAANPDHIQNNFSHDCMTCHNETTWSPAEFDHNQTQFPLTGAHQSLDCNSCHANGFANTPLDCYSCHESDYTAATDPDHVQNSFSHDCTNCHNEAAWSPAEFDHDQTQFPLTGAHQSLNCNSCHANGFANTPLDCYSCHQQDYETSSNPNHEAAGFPTDCESCHNTTRWDQTTWDHDSQYFPIYSGKHAGKWDDCADCHVDATNFQKFECIYCHAHEQSKMDDKHGNVKDYVYDSVMCYDCHPQGKH